MKDEERRSSARAKVVIQAKVQPEPQLSDGVAYACAILDASLSGCRMVCSKLDDLPNKISLSFAGFHKPLRGEIVWRKPRLAGVRLVWDEADRAKLFGRALSKDKDVLNATQENA